MWQHLGTCQACSVPLCSHLGRKTEHKLPAVPLLMDSHNPSSRKPGKVSVLEQPHDSSGNGLALWAVGSGVGQVLESNGEMQMSRLLNISTREDERGRPRADLPRPELPSGRPRWGPEVLSTARLHPAEGRGCCHTLHYWIMQQHSISEQLLSLLRGSHFTWHKGTARCWAGMAAHGCRTAWALRGFGAPF